MRHKPKQECGIVLGTLEVTALARPREDSRVHRRLAPKMTHARDISHQGR